MPCLENLGFSESSGSCGTVCSQERKLYTACISQWECKNYRLAPAHSPFRDMLVFSSGLSQCFWEVEGILHKQLGHSTVRAGSSSSAAWVLSVLEIIGYLNVWMRDEKCWLSVGSENSKLDLRCVQGFLVMAKRNEHLGDAKSELQGIYI